MFGKCESFGHVIEKYINKEVLVIYIMAALNTNEVIYKIESQGCPDCKKLNNFIERHGIKVDKTINISHCTEEEMMFVSQLGIMSVPVLLKFDDNMNVLDMVFGYDETKLQKWVK